MLITKVNSIIDKIQESILLIIYLFIIRLFQNVGTLINGISMILLIISTVTF